jgi:post-segregation antitoxin (ccd killing protein)
MQIHVQIITRVPMEVQRDFKAACAARGVSMSAVLLAAIRREISKSRKARR